MKKINSLIILAIFSFILTGCFAENDPRYETYVVDRAGNKFELNINTNLSNLPFPESVTLQNQNLLVSNFGGAATESATRGYISNGAIPLVTGLDDPKGMAIVGTNANLAIVADITNLRLVNLTTGAIVVTVPVTNAQFLNDVVALSQTVVLVSDTQTGIIHKATLNATADNITVDAAPFITSAQLGGNGVNGLAFSAAATGNSTLYIAVSTFGNNQNQGFIYEASINAQLALVGNPAQWATGRIGNGRLDGVAIKGNLLFVSQWEDAQNPARIYVFDRTPNQQTPRYTLSGGFISPADIALNTNTNILYIPELLNGRVVSINTTLLN